MRRIKKKNSIVSRKVKFICFGIIFLVLGGICFLLTPQGRPIVSSVRNVYQTIQYKAHFVLDQVSVDGRVRTNQDEFNEALSLSQGMPMSDIDLVAMRKRLMELPWVKEVSVQRYLPSRLFIQLTEKKPIALWQHNKMYRPLDEDGKPINDTKAVLKNILLVVGEDAPEHTLALIETLDKYPEIAVKVRSAVRVGKRRWNLILNDAENGMEVYLPDTDIDAALHSLQKENNLDQLLKRNLTVIDLRVPDRFIVRTKGGKS